MSKTSVLAILSFCLFVSGGFAFDLFYSHAVYDFESCLAYGTQSTSTRAECFDKEGTTFYSNEQGGVPVPVLSEEIATSEISKIATSSEE